MKEYAKITVNGIYTGWIEKDLFRLLAKVSKRKKQ